MIYNIYNTYARIYIDMRIYIYIYVCIYICIRYRNDNDIEKEQ